MTPSSDRSLAAPTSVFSVACRSAILSKGDDRYSGRGDVAARHDADEFAGPGNRHRCRETPDCTDDCDT